MRKRKAIKDGSLVRFASEIELLAEDIFKSGTRREKLQMAKELLPYVYRKQPMDTEMRFPDGVRVIRDNVK